MKKAITVLLIVCLVACKDSHHECQRVPDVQTFIPELVIVHDTVTIEREPDPLDVETIHYFKNLTAQLWRAVELVQLNTPESEREIEELNKQILVERALHNDRVTKTFLKSIKKELGLK